MGLFRKGKTRIIAKFLRTDLVICSHSRQGKTRLITEKIQCIYSFYILYAYDQKGIGGFVDNYKYFFLLFLHENKGYDPSSDNKGFNSLTTRKQLTKFSSANFQKMLCPRYTILKIQRLESQTL